MYDGMLAKLQPLLGGFGFWPQGQSRVALFILCMARLALQFGRAFSGEDGVGVRLRIVVEDCGRGATLPGYSSCQWHAWIRLYPKHCSPKECNLEVHLHSGPSSEPVHEWVTDSQAFTSNVLAGLGHLYAGSSADLETAALSLSSTSDMAEALRRAFIAAGPSSG